MSLMKSQVNLPISIAFGVVLQGIRIRFGRSVVTIMGVTLGIAFLMSILTGQVIKGGVSEEDSLRAEVGRMYSFMIAEMGPPVQRTIAVVQLGPLNEPERRLLARLDREGLGQINWTSQRVNSPNLVFKDTKVVETSIDKTGAGAQALLVLGAGAASSAPLERIISTMADKRVMATRKTQQLAPAQGVSGVTLEKELRPDELAKMESDAMKSRFRSVWIIIISLVVTVIGISNAMLMSVTERFREIGTMKCLGALSSFIRKIFLIESSLMGVVGGALGAALGMGFSLLANIVIYGAGLVIASLEIGPLMLCFALCILAGVALSVVAAIYPASVASSMMPAMALRTNV